MRLRHELQLRDLIGSWNAQAQAEAAAKRSDIVSTLGKRDDLCRIYRNFTNNASTPISNIANHSVIMSIDRCSGSNVLSNVISVVSKESMEGSASFVMKSLGLLPTTVKVNAFGFAEIPLDMILVRRRNGHRPGNEYRDFFREPLDCQTGTSQILTYIEDLSVYKGASKGYTLQAIEFVEDHRSSRTRRSPINAGCLPSLI